MKDFAKKDREALLNRRVFAEAFIACAVCFLLAFLIGVTFGCGVPNARHSQSVSNSASAK